MMTMAKFSFIKHLTTTHVKSSSPDPVGDPHLHILDDDWSGQDIYGKIETILKEHLAMVNL